MWPGKIRAVVSISDLGADSQKPKYKEGQADSATEAAWTYLRYEGNNFSLMVS
jgi:hypothetical protein